ncbi:metallophosphoesterase [Thermosynechococcaceae cyanobacterium BACA0444]|uniref:Nuclease SbcCD subunit D n=1 Tax=Pseudocalidococcus azoricus BACA0444 TaxID=2918990 RepID=A0AAE4JWV7_9CYAN|nr:metallophosphoesterase [Pseudocalidococcus azoricus]MDS3859319.1 metallophosphoesterase [Pseudocalidococcus azoricus BACA0444]
MPRFLHLADVHLGFDKYNNPERTLDFFFAFQDAVIRYGLEAQVDFVVIAGDLFEQRQILPATLNQAQVVLNQLKAANIPVLAIEGNHDYRPYGTKTSWLKYLSDLGLLYLLEPDEHEILQAWDESAGTGGYLDLACGVRVIGSRWYGSAAVTAIKNLAAQIDQLPSGPTTTVMLFHQGLEGQIARYAGALRYQDLLPLKDAGVDYLALGHIHRNYSYENWIFNPGSVEANSIAESQAQTPRGVYLVELKRGKIKAQLQRDYQQRPILRLHLEIRPEQLPNQIEAAAQALVQSHWSETPEAIVELRITGQIGFERSELHVRQLRDQLHRQSQALIFLLKYDVTTTAYETAFSGPELPSRLEIEQTVFTDLLAAQAPYRDVATTLASGLSDLKARVLQQDAPEEQYDYVAALLAGVGLLGDTGSTF